MGLTVLLPSLCKGNLRSGIPDRAVAALRHRFLLEGAALDARGLHCGIW
jgi:hypothetical protein